MAKKTIKNTKVEAGVHSSVESRNGKAFGNLHSIDVLDAGIAKFSKT